MFTSHKLALELRIAPKKSTFPQFIAKVGREQHAGPRDSVPITPKWWPNITKSFIAIAVVLRDNVILNRFSMRTTLAVDIGSALGKVKENVTFLQESLLHRIFKIELIIYIMIYNTTKVMSAPQAPRKNWDTELVFSRCSFIFPRFPWAKSIKISVPKAYSS